MTDRVVVFASDLPKQFLIDVCAALADATNEPYVWVSADEELVTVYAEAVIALARVRRTELEEHPGSQVHLAVIDHLVQRIEQIRAGEIGFRLADVVDRLHAESLREPVGV